MPKDTLPELRLADVAELAQTSNVHPEAYGLNANNQQPGVFGSMNQNPSNAQGGEAVQIVQQNVLETGECVNYGQVTSPQIEMASEGFAGGDANSAFNQMNGFVLDSNPQTFAVPVSSYNQQPGSNQENQSFQTQAGQGIKSGVFFEQNNVNQFSENAFESMNSDKNNSSGDCQPFQMSASLNVSSETYPQKMNQGTESGHLADQQTFVPSPHDTYSVTSVFDSNQETDHLDHTPVVSPHQLNSPCHLENQNIQNTSAGQDVNHYFQHSAVADPSHEGDSLLTVNTQLNDTTANSQTDIGQENQMFRTNVHNDTTHQTQYDPTSHYQQQFQSFDLQPTEPLQNQHADYATHHHQDFVVSGQQDGKMSLEKGGITGSNEDHLPGLNRSTTQATAGQENVLYNEAAQTAFGQEQNDPVTYTTYELSADSDNLYITSEQHMVMGSPQTTYTNPNALYAEKMDVNDPSFAKMETSPSPSSYSSPNAFSPQGSFDGNTKQIETNPSKESELKNGESYYSQGQESIFPNQGIAPSCPQTTNDAQQTLYTSPHHQTEVPVNAPQQTLFHNSQHLSGFDSPTTFSPQQHSISSSDAQLTDHNQTGFSLPQANSHLTDSLPSHVNAAAPNTQYQENHFSPSQGLQPSVVTSPPQLNSLENQPIFASSPQSDTQHTLFNTNESSPLQDANVGNQQSKSSTQMETDNMNSDVSFMNPVQNINSSNDNVQGSSHKLPFEESYGTNAGNRPDILTFDPNSPQLKGSGHSSPVTTQFFGNNQQSPAENLYIEEAPKSEGFSPAQSNPVLSNTTEEPANFPDDYSQANVTDKTTDFNKEHLNAPKLFGVLTSSTFMPNPTNMHNPSSDSSKCGISFSSLKPNEQILLNESIDKIVALSNSQSNLTVGQITDRCHASDGTDSFMPSGQQGSSNQFNVDFRQYSEALNQRKYEETSQNVNSTDVKEGTFDSKVNHGPFRFGSELSVNVTQNTSSPTGPLSFAGLDSSHSSRNTSGQVSPVTVDNQHLHSLQGGSGQQSPVLSSQQYQTEVYSDAFQTADLTAETMSMCDSVTSHPAQTTRPLTMDHDTTSQASLIALSEQLKIGSVQNPQLRMTGSELPEFDEDTMFNINSNHGDGNIHIPTSLTNASSAPPLSFASQLGLQTFNSRPFANPSVEKIEHSVSPASASDGNEETIFRKPANDPPRYKKITGRAKKMREASLCQQFPSSIDGYKLEIVDQPDDHHRARYKTEGSRGSVKDRSLQGHPSIKLTGVHQAVTLQVFVGNDSGKVKPHGFYQACKVCGKNSTPCNEKDIEGTTIIELQMDPAAEMIAKIDCVGILKLRNADVEQRMGLAKAKKKSLKARLVFRVSFKRPDGIYQTLQVASHPILCTQPVGLPEVCKVSLLESLVDGGGEMFMIGKNFMKGTKVVFEELDENSKVVWQEEGEIDKDYFQNTHLICVVPAYRNLQVTSPVKAQVVVKCGGKGSFPRPFTYLPKVKQERMEVESTLHKSAIGKVSPAALHLNELISRTSSNAEGMFQLPANVAQSILTDNKSTKMETNQDTKIPDNLIFTVPTQSHNAVNYPQPERMVILSPTLTMLNNQPFLLTLAYPAGGLQTGISIHNLLSPQTLGVDNMRSINTPLTSLNHTDVIQQINSTSAKP